MHEGNITPTTPESASFEISKQAEQITKIPAHPEALRLDVFLFISFDLVGSTALKREKFQGFEWIDVIKDFYSFFREEFACEQDFSIWKYLGDEILFYKRITTPDQIETGIRHAFRSMSDFELDLENGQYDAAAPLISVKSIAWLAPIQRLVSDLAPNIVERHNRLRENLKSDDQVIGKLPGNGASSEPFDFLGPNIDAGFRMANFSRRKQLVVSLALAHYLFQRGVCTNDLRIVHFEELKGVAAGRLYPGIWYSERWDSIQSSLSYEDRYRDDAWARSVWAGQHEPIDLLPEIHRNLEPHGYSFGEKFLDDIIALSSADSRSSSRE